jgi:hypothetical protein
MTYARTMDRADYNLRSAQAHLEAGETGLANWRADCAIRLARAVGLGDVVRKATEIFVATGGDENELGLDNDRVM